MPKYEEAIKGVESIKFHFLEPYEGLTAAADIALSALRDAQARENQTPCEYCKILFTGGTNAKLLDPNADFCSRCGRNLKPNEKDIGSAYFTDCIDNELGHVFRCSSCENEMYGHVPNYCSKCGIRFGAIND